MARRKNFEIKLKSPIGKIPATHRLGEYITFKIDTAKITVYKPGVLDDRRADPSKFNVTIGRSAKDPITVLPIEQVDLIGILVDQAKRTLLKEEGENQ